MIEILMIDFEILFFRFLNFSPGFKLGLNFICSHSNF